MSEQKEIVRNPVERWERDMEHHPKSVALFQFIKALDFEFGDFFCWKSGGDGDNGEELMYHLDVFFETQEQTGGTPENRIKELEWFVRDIRDNYDHDTDSHRYNTAGCRVCNAEKLIGPSSI